MAVVPLTPEQFLHRIDDIITILIEAMRYPQDIFEPRKRMLSTYAFLSGFKSYVAFESTHPNVDTDPILGFSMVCTPPSPSWGIVVKPSLEQINIPELDAMWDHSAELAEIHVPPQYQGKGIGRNLLKSSIEGARESQARTLLLTTPINGMRRTPAIEMYESEGFTVLHPQFYFPKNPIPILIMGLSL